jgi:EAL domain-containing protein (putative c-di-GMP-specific phosphodiesterase class I)/GGDEF domain-containing protein
MTEYIFRYEVAACLIAIAIRLAYFQGKKIKTTTSQAFNALSWQCLTSSLCNIASVFLIKYIRPGNLWLNYITIIAYYIIFNAIPLCFYICVYALSENNRRLPKKRFWWFFGIYLFFSVFTITSPFTHFIFWFNEDLELCHNILFYGYYVLDLFYLIAGLIHFLRHRNQFTTNQTVSLMFYTCACFATAIIQTIYPRLLITGFMFALTILITYLSMENPDDYVDSESHLFSRLAFKVKCQSDFAMHHRNLIIGIYAESLFHILNSLGEVNRDAFYKEVTNTLKEITGSETIFRLTYEKIAIIVPFESDEKSREIVERINNYFREPVKCGPVEVSLAISIKTVKIPDDVGTIEDLLDLLEDSLEDKTVITAGSVYHADVSLLEKRRRENRIIQILEESMDQNNFEVVYQPIYNIAKAGYTSAEALIRLKTEEFGYIEPDEFIPLAEKNGLALLIGNFVLNEVCRFYSENRLWEKGIEKIHVNLSVIQCMQEKMYEHIFEVLDYYNLDYEYINLDVTETTTIAANEILLRNMNIMKDHNMMFSLDNYGTGLSNTNTLVKYPFKYVKLDRALIQSAVNDEKARVILHKTVSMIKDLNMETVAEGVEDLGQYDMVIYLNCDYIQGYMFANPLNAAEFLKFISK